MPQSNQKSAKTHRPNWYTNAEAAIHLAMKAATTIVTIYQMFQHLIN